MILSDVLLLCILEVFMIHFGYESYKGGFPEALDTRKREIFRNYNHIYIHSLIGEIYSREKSEQKGTK